MKNLKRSAVLTLLVLTTALAAPIVDGSLSAISDGTSITIRWRSEDETAVARYEIERKAGVNGQFMPLVAIPVLGNNNAYQYVDDSAFRITESIYQYQIKVLFTNGAAPVYYGPITVRHDVNTVNRTWGSIKAMFR